MKESLKFNTAAQRRVFFCLSVCSSHLQVRETHACTHTHTHNVLVPLFLFCANWMCVLQELLVRAYVTCPNTHTHSHTHTHTRHFSLCALLQLKIVSHLPQANNIIVVKIIYRHILSGSFQRGAAITHNF